MKKIISFCMMGLAALFLCSKAEAVAGGQLIYDNYLPIPSAVAVNSTVSIRADGIDWASAQIVVGSVTQPSQTFNDGSQATATLTVASYAALSTAAATGQITVLTNSSLGGVYASTTIVIQSNVSDTQVQITGPPLNGFPITMTVGGTLAAGFASSNTAVNMAALLTPALTQNQLNSSVSGSSVTINFISSGTFGNAYLVTSSSPSAISTGASFAGGVNPAAVTVNTAVLATPGQWALGVVSSMTAVNIANAIQLYIGSTTAVSPVPIKAAANGAGVVFSTAVIPGTAGNAYTLSSNISSITVSGAHFTGGTDNATVSINGLTLTANKDFYPITSNAVTGAAIGTAWNATVGSQTVTLGTSGGVIGATVTLNGSFGNKYSLTSSTNGALTITVLVSSQTAGPSIGTFSGGTDPSYLLNTSTITIAGQTYGQGEGVYITTTTNVIITPLATNVTYYVITNAALGPNAIELATTSTGAAVNLPIVLTSSTTKVAANLYTIIVPAIAGTPSVQWLASNDQTHWLPYVLTPFNIAIPSVSYTAYYSTGSVNNFDFGHYNYGYIGLGITSPTSGAVSIGAQIVGNAP